MTIRTPLHRIGDLAAIALILLAFSQGLDALRHHLCNPEDWLRIDRLAVPDHAAGADPIVLVERTVS